MSILTATVSNGKRYKNAYFTLRIIPYALDTKIRMDFLIPFFDTKNFPQTTNILRKNLPSIMRSKCFNENNFSFAKEVKRTELGHLFEHMILEYICDLKRTAGVKNPVHNGLTSWNWQKDLPGRFYINLDVAEKDGAFLEEAIKRSANLLTKIIKSSSVPFIFSKTSEINSIENPLISSAESL